MAAGASVAAMLDAICKQIEKQAAQKAAD